MPDKRKIYANTEEMMKAKREAADKTAEDFAGVYGSPTASPEVIDEDELFEACKERAAEFDAPPDEPPGLFSNFIKWWEEQNAIAMSKEIPMMATVRDLRDLRLEDIGLLAFSGNATCVK